MCNKIFMTINEIFFGKYVIFKLNVKDKSVNTNLEILLMKINEIL